MRIALISDIHANLMALEATLAYPLDRAMGGIRQRVLPDVFADHLRTGGTE